MTLKFGREYLAIPGPSVVPDRVLAAMHRPSPNIYEGALHEMVDTLYPDLKAVARTGGDVAIYICNGHGTWEASVANIFSPGDKALVLANGRFGEGWAAAAQAMGVEVDLHHFGRQHPVDINKLEDLLRADQSHQYKAVMVVHTDTASTVRNDIPAIRQAMDTCKHPALLMVDCIASLACDRFEMDDWGVDVAISASQKGLMLPPGLGFVWFSEKAHQAHKAATLSTPYWDWSPRTRGDMFFQKFDGTAPTQHLYGLREALDMLLHEEGLEAAWTRHERLATAVWAALDGWAKTGPLRMNIADPGARSHAVTSVRLGAPLGTSLRRWLEANTGVTLGIGLGMNSEEDPNSDGYLRIAHMGHVNAHMTLGVLSTIEAGLIALDIPHGEGALTAAARIVAGTQ